MNVGSLFTGVGGMDLGFEQAGFQVAWQVENNEQCKQLLEDKWKGVPKYGDIRECYRALPYADIVIGGDPCPKHSRARSNGDSRSPDLSGYFLAVVGRLRPWWVVRENVPAPSVDHFDAALAYLGYGTVVVRVDAAKITGQSRQRDFVVGQYKGSRESVRRVFADFPNGSGPYTTRLGPGQVTPALTTHRTRYDSRDCYVWEEPDRLRILDGEEREALAGLPPGHTAGFSEATRARMCGNCVVPGAANIIATVIGYSIQRNNLVVSGLVKEAA
jgi:DNA (cytosine-5)-methyltransferase 1